MFIISLTYTKPVEEVDKVLQQHIEYIDRYFAEGVFICSGRKVPRTGGVIFAKAADIQEAERIVNEDPFITSGVAEAEITEFVPTRFADGLDGLK